MEKMNNIKVQAEVQSFRYFLRETGGLVRLADGVLVFSLDQNGEWVPNQYLYSMFVDGMVDYEEISAAEAARVIKTKKAGQRKNKPCLLFAKLKEKLCKYK